jgi:hypothetical protein
MTVRDKLPAYRNADMKFKTVTSAGGSVKYNVNVDQVLYAQQATTKPDECTLHFAGAASVTINVSADTFVKLSRQ